MDDAPEMAPYARHVFFCTGEYCDPERKATRLYHLFGRYLGELGQYDNPERVKRGECPCLGVCYGGPLMVVYPEGIWYHHVDEAAMRRIVDEHLREGRVVEDLVFHRLEQPEPSGK